MLKKREWFILGVGILILGFFIGYGLIGRHVTGEGQRQEDCFLALRQDCHRSTVWSFFRRPSAWGEEGVELREEFAEAFPVSGDDLTRREVVSTNGSGAPIFFSVSFEGAKYDNGVYYLKSGHPVRVRLAAYPAEKGEISWSNGQYMSSGRMDLKKENQRDSEFDGVNIFSGDWAPGDDVGMMTISASGSDGKKSWMIVEVKIEK